MSEPARILVVEDEGMNRALLRATLARAGEPLRSAQLFEAETIAVARDVLDRGDVDIVLLDIRLPDGSGLDLARDLTARNGGHRPRIVILSASVMPEERATALAAGCDAFLPKPYRPSDLVELVGSLLRTDGS